MAHFRKGPAGANRQAFYQLQLTFPIVSSPHPEAKCLLRQLATVYGESVNSENPRVIRLGLQILWRHLREILLAQDRS
jgi:hypothetical protein